MMDRIEIENIIITQLTAFQPVRVGFFGSFARNEMTPDSDIDILVSFKNPVSLIQLIRIENSISEQIGIKVDLVTENSVRNEKLKGFINRDLQIIYNA
jgi:uncharacterized protein